MFANNRIPALFSVGTNVEGSLSVQECIEKSGMGFTVSKRPLTYMGMDGQTLPIYDKVAIVRDDNDALMGVASPSYGIMQYEHGFNILNSLIQGENKFVRAGFTRNGARAFITAQIGGEWLVGGREEERHLTYLTARMSHDSSSIFECFLMFYRTICSNGMKAMVPGKGFTAKHSKNILSRTDNIASVLGFIQEAQDFYSYQMKSLMEQTVNMDYIEQFVNTLMPSQEKEASTRLRNNRDNLKSLILRGAGNYGKTKADCLNGATEYADHLSSGRITETRVANATEEEIEAEQRWERCIDGSGEALKARARELVLAA